MAHRGRLALALAVVAALLPVGALHGASRASATVTCDYYVSPTGSDSAAGTLSAPWLTPDKARNYIEANHLNQNMTADLTVCLRGGTYTRSTTFTLTDADSGSNGHNVVFAAYPGETPIIDGGKAVTGWTQVAGKNYWQASVPTTSGFASYFRQLYVNGVRAPLASSGPISGTGFFRDTTVWNPGEPNPPVTPTPPLYDGITFAASALKASYTNVTDLRLFQRSTGFKGDYFPVTKITSDGTTVKMYLQQPYFQYRVDHGTGNINYTDTFYLQNSFEDLDNPGEWYLNQATHTVYYYPLPGQTMAGVDVEAPVVQTLVSVGGSSSSAKAGNIEFTGITFQHGNWLAPGTAYIGGSQAEALYSTDISDPAAIPYAYVDSVPGMITASETQNFQFLNNTVRYSGDGGLALGEGAADSTVTGNVFYNTTAAGIIVGRWADLLVSAAERTDTATINDNIVYDTGDDFIQATGISLMNTNNVTVTHNLVYNTAYAGIHQRMSSPDTDTTVYDGTNGYGAIGKTTFSYNKVYNAGDMKQYGLFDSGSIYSHGAWPGTVVDYNYVYDVTTGFAYYSDNNSYQIKWENNFSNGGPYHVSTTYLSPDSVYGLNDYTTTNTNGKSNGWIDETTGQVGYTPPVVTQDSTGHWPTAVQSIISGAGLESAYATLTSKVPDYNRADYDTVGQTSSSWVAADLARAWDGRTETGPADAGAGTVSGQTVQAWIEYDFGLPHAANGFTFTIQDHAASAASITAWKVQRWSASTGTWIDIMPYRTMTASQIIDTYTPAASLATGKIRLYVENTNPGGQIGFDEFTATGTPT